MNFNAPLLKPLRILLFPFSLVYAMGVLFRNWLFDHQVIRAASFQFPLICIGNLSVGGTGKSTMVEFLVGKMNTAYRIAVLSRGYKRKTKGYAVANDKSTALEIGDEPMQFHLKFPELIVAVGEERLVAIPQLLHDHPECQVILLDDAFQHRSVSAGLNILLTEYHNLYTRDWYLPTGDLRDSPTSSRRSQLIVVTKCPPNLGTVEKQRIEKELYPAPDQQLFFSTLVYGKPYHILSRSERLLGPDTEVLLVSGIANPQPLKQYLVEHTQAYEEILYDDHHIFSIDDWKEINARFNQLAAPEKLILTTEKDAVRLIKFAPAIGTLPLFVIPIEMKFLFEGEAVFLDAVQAYVRQFPHSNNPS